MRPLLVAFLVALAFAAFFLGVGALGVLGLYHHQVAVGAAPGSAAKDTDDTDAQDAPGPWRPRRASPARRFSRPLYRATAPPRDRPPAPRHPGPPPCRPSRRCRRRSPGRSTCRRCGR